MCIFVFLIEQLVVQLSFEAYEFCLSDTFSDYEII